MLSPYPPPTTFEKRPNIFQRLAAAVLPVPRARPFSEMGVSGTATWGGYVQTQEKSSAWIGRQKYITISDMVINTSIIAAGFHYFLNLVSHPEWSLEPADDSAEAKAAAEFVEEVLHSMAMPWSSIVRRASTYRFWGFGIQEWTALRRPDGRIGLASIEPRPQHTIEQWAVAADGTVEGVFQRSPTTGEELGLPRSKILYLADTSVSDSPEGTGIFRMLAESWERLKMYNDLEARAFERDLRGIPVGRVPYSLIRQAVDDGKLTQADADLLVQGMENFVQLQVKKSNTSITLDSIPYFSQAADGAKVAATPQWGLELLQGASAGVEHIGAAIVRTQHEMARIIGTESLLMGENSGNRALSADKSRNLYLVANALLGEVAAGVDHDIVARICDLNGIKEELRPKCDVEEVAFKDADSIAGVLSKMAQAGAVLAPDDPVIEDVRGLMGVSPPSPVSPEMAAAAMAGNTPGADEEEEEDDAEDEEIGKAFNPNQPRVPAGNSAGGQFTSEGNRTTPLAPSATSAAKELGLGVEYTGADAPARMHSLIVDSPLKKTDAISYSQVQDMDDALMRGGDDKYSTVPLASLEMVQDYVFPERVQQYITGDKNAWLSTGGIIVATINGRDVVLDGTHRAVAAHLKGVSDIKIRHIGELVPTRSGSWTRSNRFGLGKAAPQTLYVKRRLLNADAVRAWAATQGIVSTLAPDDMHVTVAFSKEPFDVSGLVPLTNVVVVSDGVEKAYDPNQPRDEQGQWTSGSGDWSSPIGGEQGSWPGRLSEYDQESGRVDAFVQSIETQFEAGARPEPIAVDPKTLFATQSWLSDQGGGDPVFPDLEDALGKYPVVARTPDGRMHIIDGHHTAFFAGKSGRAVDVLVFDYKPNAVSKAGRAVHQFPPRNTPNGALVLKFNSPALEARWQAFRDAGASWDFPAYEPHVTLTYSVPEADVAAVTPYAGPLIFGPEEFADVNDGWASEIVEVPTVAKKKGVPRYKPMRSQE